ncbi:MAG: diguanylate cyclase [Alteromonadaceae bacterium]|nr:diguanylate cyclase [Alteromonadaceae bacterium]
MQPESQQENEKQTVLVVDDAISNIKMLGEILRDECNVIFATNGKTALAQAQKMRPDLILLDVIMPEMDGYEVCRLLKENNYTSHIPIIFVTALDNIQDEEKGLELGAIDYITKPFHPPIIKMRIRNHLELVQHRERLKMLSTTDGLTGIANRRRFDDLLNKEWRRAFREREFISILLIDIDNFKKYNDFYGHLQGDECLRHVAQALSQSQKRDTDVIARYGGEEFASILPNTDLIGAESFAQKLMEKIEELNIPHQNNADFGRITLSIGIASVKPQDNVQIEDIISFADGCLYEAKENGRNKVVGRLFTT